jgi:hypothetical protein
MLSDTCSVMAGVEGDGTEIVSPFRRSSFSSKHFIGGSMLGAAADVESSVPVRRSSMPAKRIAQALPEAPPAGDGGVPFRRSSFSSRRFASVAREAAAPAVRSPTPIAVSCSALLVCAALPGPAPSCAVLRGALPDSRQAQLCLQRKAARIGALGF